MNLSFQSKKNINLVFDFLTDMQKFVSVHPVILQIDKTGDDCYLVHERLKLGFIPFLFSYPVLIEINKLNNTVTYRATVLKFTKIEMKFVLKVENGFTQIDEEIQFTSPFPVEFILKSIFKKQHQKLFKNIEQK